MTVHLKNDSIWNLQPPVLKTVQIRMRLNHKHLEFDLIVTIMALLVFNCRLVPPPVHVQPGTSDVQTFGVQLPGVDSDDSVDLQAADESDLDDSGRGILSVSLIHSLTIKVRVSSYLWIAEPRNIF